MGFWERAQTPLFLKNLCRLLQGCWPRHAPLCSDIGAASVCKAAELPVALDSRVGRCPSLIVFGSTIQSRGLYYSRIKIKAPGTQSHISDDHLSLTQEPYLPVHTGCHSSASCPRIFAHDALQPGKFSNFSFLSQSVCHLPLTLSIPVHLNSRQDQVSVACPPDCMPLICLQDGLGSSGDIWGPRSPWFPWSLSQPQLPDTLPPLPPAPVEDLG